MRCFKEAISLGFLDICQKILLIFALPERNCWTDCDYLPDRYKTQRFFPHSSFVFQVFEKILKAPRHPRCRDEVEVAPKCLACRQAGRLNMNLPKLNSKRWDFLPGYRTFPVIPGAIFWLLSEFPVEEKCF